MLAREPPFPAALHGYLCSLEKQLRFHALDSWRGLCAVLVALLHYRAIWHLHEFPLIRNSYLFVDFFFVLSGFVIAHAYGDRIGDLADFGRFVALRLGRLWPLHATVLGLFLAVEIVALVLEPWLGGAYPRPPFTESRSPFAILTNILLVHSLGLHPDVTWNFPSWSISVEFYTYLVFATVLLVLHRFRVVAALALVLFGAAVLVMERGSMDVTVHYGLFRCLVGFFFGCLAFRAYRVTASRLGGRLPGANLAEPVCIILVLAFIAAAGTGPLSFLAPLVFMAMVFIFAFEDGAVSRFMKTPVLLRLGALSYSIYMVHAFVLLILENSSAVVGKVLGVRLETEQIVGGSSAGLLDFGNPWIMDGVALVYLAAVIALASVTYRYIEVPGYDAAKRFVNRRSRVVTGAARHQVSRG
jgi:peptidoglycan/LPS O-acetylase OafA/YrhL